MICVLSGCDSDRHLGEPVVKSLRKLGFRSEIVGLVQNDIPESYKIVNRYIEKFTVRFILAVGDRSEQLGGVLAAFHGRVPVGHLFAGDVNFPVSCFDDVHRHCITLYSCIQFCSSGGSEINVRNLMRSVGLSDNAYVVGFTHFDGIDFDKIKEKYRDDVENKKYVLVLVNAETMGDNFDVIKSTVDHIKENPGLDVLIAKGNGDMDIEKLVARRLDDLGIKHELLPRLDDHGRFLNLMMCCDKFITNSSCAVYEAPFLMSPENIVSVGLRNLNRTSVSVPILGDEDGKLSNYINRTQYASGRIAELIKDYLYRKEVK